MASSFHKYALYEKSVQSPKTDVDWMVTIYKQLHEKYPRHLREDFCGTFQICCEWVKRNRNNTAVGLDLDPEPLTYGKRKNFARLTAEQKTRLEILKADVLQTVTPKKDLIVAGNFSFFIFKKRPELLKYFQNCFKSLRSKGTLVLEMAGGPGMIATMKEKKTVRLTPKLKVTYTWDQKSFDPIHQNAQYAIHFQLPNGKQLKNAFHYDWRLWSIPEVRDALTEAGFSKTVVLWETEHRGRGTGEYIPSEEGDNAYSWIAYVVGIR